MAARIGQATFNLTERKGAKPDDLARRLFRMSVKPAERDARRLAVAPGNARNRLPTKEDSATIEGGRICP